MRTVADIGGGKGTLLAAILRAHNHMRGVLFDQPSVVADAAGVFRSAGVADRCQIVPGDFFEAVPQGAGIYILANTRSKLMARSGLGHDHCLTFSQVELRGLEPLTPCLQSMAKLSRTVYGLGWTAPSVRVSTPASRLVGVGCGCRRSC